MLEPLKPVLDELALILLGVGKIVVMFVKPMMDLFARYVLPQLQIVTAILSAILRVFGLKIDQSDLDALEGLQDGATVELRLDTSEALRELERARDRLLGAGDETLRAAARQSFLAAREAAILATQREQTAAAPEDIWGQQTDSAFLGVIEDLGNVLGKIFDTLAAGFGVINKIWNFFDTLVRGFIDTVTELWRAGIGILQGLYNAVYGSAQSMFAVIYRSVIWVRDVLRRVIEALAPIADVLERIADVLKAVGGSAAGIISGIAGSLGFASGSNLTGSGMAMLHDNEAILPSRYNPSSPAFDPLAFWQPALAALGGAGGGAVTINIDARGAAPGVERSIVAAIRKAERSGELNRITRGRS